MEIKMVLDLPRDAVSVPVSRQVLDSCLETLGVRPDTRADIAFALSGACANVIQHGRPASLAARRGRGAEQSDWFPLPDDPVSATAEHGRGLKIIDAVADNLQLTSNHRQGTTVHFEKTLEWLPGAAGQHLFNADGVA